MSESKALALAKHLSCQLDDIKPYHYNENEFRACGGDYLVLTEEEADVAATNDIFESVWAFNADFLAQHTDLDAESIKLIQDTDKCEALNPLFKRLIKDMDAFVADAIAADGRGHFIAHYDNEEGEVCIENTLYYIYRTN